jgi:hypothetical protein
MSKKTFALSAVLAVGLAANAMLAAQSTTSSGRQVARSRAMAPVPIGSIKEIMDGIVDPTADVLFDAVSYNITAAGVEEKMPRTNDEWAEIRRHALLLVEVTNLLKMPGRKVAPATPVLEFEREDPSPEDLTPEQIQALIDADPAKFTRHAQTLTEAALVALRAADAKNVDQLFSAGDEIDKACESCHLEYWYPKDKKPAIDALSRRKK